MKQEFINKVESARILSKEELAALSSELLNHEGVPQFYDSFGEAAEDEGLEVLFAGEHFMLGLQSDGELVVVGDNGGRMWVLSGTVGMGDKLAWMPV
tara:strand:- start:1049 stop:1339 length:291 start_codon:yes stop_codon:yes gene_type:complete